MVHYADGKVGLDAVSSFGDGYTVNLKWFRAYPDIITNKIAHHIYYSTNQDTVFSEGVKYICIDGYATEANVIDLTPGQLYYFSVRPVEYDPLIFNLSTLPIAYDDLRFYPQSLLRQSISAIDMLIPLIDSEGFPHSGVMKVGVELIKYSNVINNNLLASVRGYGNSRKSEHLVSGFDGYVYRNPAVTIFTAGEQEKFDLIFMCQSRFEYPNYAFTMVDGYHQETKDLLTSDLSGSDILNSNFPPYDYAGYHRTDPVQLLNGTCLGSYIGGEMYVRDGYGFKVLRGMSFRDQNNQRQEMALSVMGTPAVLIKRMRTGITCSCYLASSEYPEDRCSLCHGTKFVMGYEQYFDTRRSDGRIMIRVGPTDEDLKMYEAGLESELSLDCWAMSNPTIKDRDVIILFDEDDNEDYRYEVLSVTRNKTVLSEQGGQKFKAQRIRKTDPIYQVRVIRNTAMFPSKLNTSVGFAYGLPPHVHEIVINEKIMSVSQINQTTSVSQGHCHPILSGVVMQVLGHVHSIII